MTLFETQPDFGVATLDHAIGYSPILGPTGPRVLVVEDHSALNFLMGIRLRNAGYQTSSAFDGIEGMERAIAEEPDLIIVDLGLPKMSGRHLIQAIEGHPSTFETPIVVLTGESRNRDLTQLREDYQAIKAVLLKPSPCAHVVRTVRRILSERS